MNLRREGIGVGSQVLTSQLRPYRPKIRWYTRSVT